MGEDKALVQFAGRPLVERALSTLRGAGLEPSIAGGLNSESLKAFAPVVQDEEPGLGPLGGICASLESSQARWGVFLTVDLPLLPSSLIAFLLHHARISARPVTLASVNGFAQTFPAVVDCAALPALRNELKSGRGGCFAGFQAACVELSRPMTVVPVERLVQAGQASHPDGLFATRWFLNVNWREDLSRAEACVRRRIA
jgi:molybdopterin-guanine dinucleotide biosynthesis protein A